MTQRDTHTPAWIAFSYLSFCAAAAMAALGIAYLPLGIWERGYLAMAALLLVHSSVSLTKTLRDRHEAAALAHGVRPMSRALLAERRFAPLFACQFLSAFGDNFLRNALGLLVVWSAGGAPGWIVAAASGSFVLPSVLLSGLGGQLADRMDKARLIRRLKLAEIPVAGVAALGLLLGSLPVLFAGLVASGALAALFGPVKYGILPDQLPRERLTAANALVEGATFAAILLGTVASGLLVGAGAARAVLGAVVLAAAVASWAAARLVPATLPSAAALRVQADLLASTLDLLRGLRADRRIWRAVLANAWFWVAGSVVIALLPGLVRDRLGGGAALDTLCLCLFAVGIACGSGLASVLSGARTVLLPASLGCAVLGLALLDLWRVSHGLGLAPAGHAGLDLFAAALGGGLLAVPTQAAIQVLSPPERRARTVAGANVVGALAVAATAAVLVAAQLAGLREPALLGLTGLLCLPAAAVMLPALLAQPRGRGGLGAGPRPVPRAAGRRRAPAPPRTGGAARAQPHQLARRHGAVRGHGDAAAVRHRRAGGASLVGAAVPARGARPAGGGQQPLRGARHGGGGGRRRPPGAVPRGAHHRHRLADGGAARRRHHRRQGGRARGSRAPRGAGAHAVEPALARADAARAVPRRHRHRAAAAPAPGARGQRRQDPARGADRRPARRHGGGGHPHHAGGADPVRGGGRRRPRARRGAARGGGPGRGAALVSPAARGGGRAGAGAGARHRAWTRRWACCCPPRTRRRCACSGCRAGGGCRPC